MQKLFDLSDIIYTFLGTKVIFKGVNGLVWTGFGQIQYSIQSNFIDLVWFDLFFILNLFFKNYYFIS